MKLTIHDKQKNYFELWYMQLVSTRLRSVKLRSVIGCHETKVSLKY